MHLIFPADPLQPSRPDEHFANQARLAETFSTVDLYDLESARSVRRFPGGRAVYRGWMLSAGEYRLLEKNVTAKGGQLLTSTENYLKAHQLPGWYHQFKELTPQTVICASNPSDQEIDDAAAALNGGPFIVKDYVKSRKHDWFEACFAPDGQSLKAVVRRLVELQGDSLAGGVVIRRFENFTGPEARVWWLNGDPVYISSHPDTPGDAPTPPLEDVQEAVKALGCPFVTTDMVKRSDGVWRVVEVGDGQVSDFPKGEDFTQILAALEKL